MTHTVHGAWLFTSIQLLNGAYNYKKNQLETADTEGWRQTPRLCVCVAIMTKLKCACFAQKWEATWVTDMMTHHMCHGQNWYISTPFLGIHISAILNPGAMTILIYPPCFHHGTHVDSRRSNISNEPSLPPTSSAHRRRGRTRRHSAGRAPADVNSTTHKFCDRHVEHMIYINIYIYIHVYIYKDII